MVFATNCAAGSFEGIVVGTVVGAGVGVGVPVGAVADPSRIMFFFTTVSEPYAFVTVSVVVKDAPVEPQNLHTGFCWEFSGRSPSPSEKSQ